MITHHSEYEYNLYNYFLDKVRIAVFDIRTEEYSWKNFAEVDEEHQRVFAVDIDIENIDSDDDEDEDDILEEMVIYTYDALMEACDKSHAVRENYNNLFSLMQDAIIDHQIRRDNK